MTGEILNIHKEYRNYKDYKAAVDEELKRSAESFVRIGYLLKVARDTDILQESGYANVNDFARSEYALDKSQVSRFIRINDEFSQGGYSDRLQEKYRGFGHAKLSLMLMLPASVNEVLTEEFTKTDILELKEEVEEEQKISDLEVMMEEQNQAQREYGIFAKVLHQLGKDRPPLYLELWKAVMETVYDGSEEKVIKKLTEILAPAGQSMHSTRIEGEGRKLLIIMGKEKIPVITDIRSGKKDSCTWSEFIETLESLCGGESAKEGWEELYGEPFPAMEKEEPVKETRKLKRVYKAESKEESRKEKNCEKKQETGNVSHDIPEDRKHEEPAGSSPEKGKKQSESFSMHCEEKTDAGSTEQVQGQMNIEEFEEVLPEKYQKTFVAPVQPTIQGKLVKESMCLETLKDRLDKVCLAAEQREYETAAGFLREAMEQLERLKTFMESEEENGKKTT